MVACSPMHTRPVDDFCQFDTIGKLENCLILIARVPVFRPVLCCSIWQANKIITTPIAHIRHRAPVPFKKRLQLSYFVLIRYS